MNRAPVATWTVSEAELAPRYACNDVLDTLFGVHAQISFAKLNLLRLNVLKVNLLKLNLQKMSVLKLNVLKPN